MTKLVLLLVAALVICASARHLHPKGNSEDIWRNNVGVDEREENVVVKEEIVAVPLETIRNIKPSRFVPINNAIFFMGYQPCQDGFKRDIMGICREVWD